jgi:glycosyltransferase involved in cell wall biosynthesis
VGDGPNKPDLVRQAQEAGLDGMVRFEAPIPKRRVGAVMAEADLFILPLHEGGLFRWGISPNKLFDYMAAARPVVTAVDASANPVVEADAGLSVPAADPPALAQAIKTLLALSPEERWEMGLRGRRYVEAHHDMARLAERFEACLLSASGMSGSQPPPNLCPARPPKVEPGCPPRERAAGLKNLLIQVR